LSKEQYFAVVKWTIADVLILRPNWTEEEAYKWFEQNEKHIEDRMVEVGWEVMESLM
jgi:hypothetical protein